MCIVGDHDNLLFRCHAAITGLDAAQARPRRMAVGHWKPRAADASSRLGGGKKKKKNSIAVGL